MLRFLDWFAPRQSNTPMPHPPSPAFLLLADSITSLSLSLGVQAHIPDWLLLDFISEFYDCPFASKREMVVEVFGKDVPTPVSLLLDRMPQERRSYLERMDDLSHKASLGDGYARAGDAAREWKHQVLFASTRFLEL